MVEKHSIPLELKFAKLRTSGCVADIEWLYDNNYWTQLNIIYDRLEELFATPSNSLPQTHRESA